MRLAAGWKLPSARIGCVHSVLSSGSHDHVDVSSQAASPAHQRYVLAGPPRFRSCRVTAHRPRGPGRDRGRARLGVGQAAAEVLETDCDRFDLVIVNGEGSVHHNSRSAVRIAALASDLAARGRPAYLVNTSVEANSCPVLAGLSTFRLRFVRDSQTQRLLAKAGLSSHLVHDLTLTWAGFPRARSTGNLLVTDASEQGKTARLLQLSRSWGGARMITFRTNPPWPVRGGRVSRRLSFEVKRLASSFLPASPWTSRYAGAIRSGDEIVRLMSDRARGIVCGRYHAVCFALRMFLPFISTEGNTGKIGALL